MTTEALRLADDLDRGWAYKTECAEAAAELRRQHASDQAKRNALAAIYQALGTSNPDMTAWPAEIREMRNTIASQAECIRANNAERQEWQREVLSLRAEAARKEEVMSTHGPGCYAWGPGHYACALQEIKALRAARSKT